MIVPTVTDEMEFKVPVRASRATTLLSCASFASAASIRVCDPLLPQLAQTFGTSIGEAATVITAFAVAYGLSQLLYGPLGDRYNKYRLITLATLACTLSSASAAISPFLDWLIYSRAIAGITAAAIIPLSIAWIGDTVPYEQRQATLARFISGPLMGMVSGQFLGGFVADTLGWRWCFVVLAGVYVVVGILLCAQLRRENVLVTGAPSGSLPTNRLPFWAQVLNVMRIPWARIVLLTVFLESMAAFGTLAFVPSYLHTHFGVSLTVAGAVIATFGLGGLFYTSVAGRLVARFGERGLALGGGPLLGAAFLTFLLGSRWPWAVPASFAAGFGFYMLHNTLQTNATQMAPDSRGTAVSLFASVFFLGQSVGISLGAGVVDVAGSSLLFGLAAVVLPLVCVAFALVLRFR